MLCKTIVPAGIALAGLFALLLTACAPNTPAIDTDGTQDCPTVFIEEPVALAGAKLRVTLIYSETGADGGGAVDEMVTDSVGLENCYELVPSMPDRPSINGYYLRAVASFDLEPSRAAIVCDTVQPPPFACDQSADLFGGTLPDIVLRAPVE